MMLKMRSRGAMFALASAGLAATVVAGVGSTSLGSISSILAGQIRPQIRSTKVGATTLALTGGGRQGQTVRLDLQTFHCINADEDSAISDGDEPYLLPVAVFVDGNTVSLKTLSSSSAFLRRANKAHGNLNREHVRSGERFSIPAATGRFETLVTPIDTGGLADPKRTTQVGILVVACEEDATADSVINAGYNTLISTLQTELNNAIRNLQNPDIPTIQAKIQAAVMNKMKKQTLKSLNIFGAIDPDGFVGAQFSQFTFGQLEAAGTSGLPISMNFKDTEAGVEYQIEGRASFPSPPKRANVSVVINRIKAIDDLEGFGRGDPDFQARMTVDRQIYNSPEKSGETIRPNWTKTVSTLNNPVQILIELYERDGVTSADERCDINPKKGVKPLSLFIDTTTGRITGDVTGQRGVPITVRGAGDSDRCEITFTVNSN